MYAFQLPSRLSHIPQRTFFARNFCFRQMKDIFIDRNVRRERVFHCCRRGRGSRFESQISLSYLKWSKALTAPLITYKLSATCEISGSQNNCCPLQHSQWCEPSSEYIRRLYEYFGWGRPLTTTYTNNDNGKIR